LDEAAKMEAIRNKFEDEIDIIFENTQEENKEISKLIDGKNYDVHKWYDSFLSKFKKVAL